MGSGFEGPGTVNFDIPFTVILLITFDFQHFALHHNPYTIE